MTSNRPYLIRAIYDWITENGMTPHMVIDAAHPSAQLPERYVADGRMVVNVASRAVNDLHLGNDLISFTARFQGQPIHLSMEPHAVLAVYARENGEGMVFPEVLDEESDQQESADQHEEPSSSGRPGLKLVK